MYHPETDLKMRRQFSSFLFAENEDTAWKNIQRVAEIKTEELPGTARVKVRLNGEYKL